MKYIKRKSLLYKSGVEYADFCLNHVEGCAHGCDFPCYARQMAKRFGRIKDNSEWLEPRLVVNALELLDKEIPKYREQIKYVHLCFMTDPFMYGYKEVRDLTLRIIEKLNRNGIRCTILTKGIYPRILSDSIRYNDLNEYGITLVSLNNEFKKRFESLAAPYTSRIKALEFLHNEGKKTWISMEPYPTPNLDSGQDLKQILKSIRFVDRIVFGKLNYNMKSTQFENSGLFYEKCAEEVIHFCIKNKMEYHIKFGTQNQYNKKTATLFEKQNTIPAIVS